MQPKYLKFKNLQEAWEGINEYLVLEESEITERGGGISGPCMVSYNNLVVVDNGKIDDDFDFGRVLGYTIRKWSALVKNYVDFYYLDMLRAEINSRGLKSKKAYNFAYHFKNIHGSGKDCLISLNFTKRIYSPNPIVTFYTRTNEVTKRLIWDFLLVQRIIEYVYGSAENVIVQYWTDSFFVTPEGIMMYDNVWPMKKMFKKFNDPPTKFQAKLLKTYDNFMSADMEKVNFRVNRRSIAQLQKDAEGNPISGVKSLLASDIPRFDSKAYDSDIITIKQMKEANTGPIKYIPHASKNRGKLRNDEVLNKGRKLTIKKRIKLKLKK